MSGPRGIGRLVWCLSTQMGQYEAKSVAGRDGSGVWAVRAGAWPPRPACSQLAQGSTARARTRAYAWCHPPTVRSVLSSFGRGSDDYGCVWKLDDALSWPGGGPKRAPRGPSWNCGPLHLLIHPL